MVEVTIQREDGAIRTVLELYVSLSLLVLASVLKYLQTRLRSLNGHCWDSSSFVLRQLDGIGEKGYKVCFLLPP
jgi:hypothetical protein